MVNKNKKQCSLGATDDYANYHGNKITCSISEEEENRENREDKKQTEEDKTDISCVISIKTHSLLSALRPRLK